MITAAALIAPRWRVVKGGSVMSCSGPEFSGVMPISFHLTAAGRCCRAAI